MAASEVAALWGAIVSTASKIQELGNNWYKASQSWNDFPRHVECLRRKNKFWQDELAHFGMSSDKAISDTLREATLLLKEQEAKLLKRLEDEKAKLLKRSVKRVSNCFPGCWTKLSMTVFPAQLGDDIEMVIKAFEDIQALLKDEEEATGALEKRELRRTFSLPFNKDDRYVPLRVTESAIRSALDDVNPGCRRVVLLHGPAGKGKSTLARAVALHYKEITDKFAVFENVVYLECGPQADVFTKQFKLLQLLGSVAAAPQEKLVSDSHLTVAQRLKGRLRDRKLLIIFDDVWEEGFLQIMADLCGSRVKCLVTSQLGDLCRDLNCSPIEIRIEDVQLEVAKIILASHVRLPHHHIPQHLEKIADKMIQETEGNPLALASIAAGIDRTRSDELEVWEAASNNLFGMLRHESRAYIQSMKYPRSFWSTMKLSIESLEKEAQKLLILADMCDGPSVPEEVIYLLYGSTTGKWDVGAVAKLREELESRELVKITVISESPQKRRSWSIHSLKKRFIEEEMNDAKESTITSLIDLFCIQIESPAEPMVIKGSSLQEVDIIIMIILAALYFKKQFSRRLLKMSMCILSPNFNDLRRSAIEPITRLLWLPRSDRWTEKLYTSTKQVFMMYICNGVLDNEGVFNLLGSPLSIAAMITAIRNIAILEEATLLDEKSHGFIKALIDLLQGVALDGGTSATIIRKAAGEALDGLCDNVRNVACVLANLALANGEIKLKIINSVGVLEQLVKSLSLDSNPSLQKYAAWALANLAAGDDKVQLKMINSFDSRVLEELVKSLSNDNNPNLQQQATRALSNLARGGGHTKSTIIKYIGALEELIKLLSKDDNLDLQKEAARALVGLTDGDDEMKVKVINSVGVLEELVKSLSKDDNLDFQEYGAWALANLASGNGDIKLRIVNFVGALEELIKSLAKDHNPNLQKQATRALANLATPNGVINSKTLNSIGAIEELVKLLSKDNNPTLQEEAARALANLAEGDGEIKLKIANSIGTLKKFVKFLCKNDNHDFQEHVVRMIHNLGEGMLFNIEVPREVQASKLKLDAIEGLNEGLLNLLAKHIPPTIQYFAARALTLINRTQASEARLHSGFAYFGRGNALAVYGFYEAALADLDKAHNSLPQKDSILSHRCFVKAKMGDYQGALVDINKAIEIKRTSFGLQERGVLKQMMGDLHGALVDLNEGLNIKANDYEMLKHRGYVKFLMKDMVGANIDGKWALKVKSSCVHDQRYWCLGTSSIEYMDYKLR